MQKGLQFGRFSHKNYIIFTKILIKKSILTLVHRRESNLACWVKAGVIASSPSRVCSPDLDCTGSVSRCTTGALQEANTDKKLCQCLPATLWRYLRTAQTNQTCSLVFLISLNYDSTSGFSARLPYFLLYKLQRLLRKHQYLEKPEVSVRVFLQAQSDKTVNATHSACWSQLWNIRTLKTIMRANSDSSATFQTNLFLCQRDHLTNDGSAKTHCHQQTKNDKNGAKTQPQILFHTFSKQQRSKIKPTGLNLLPGSHDQCNLQHSACKKDGVGLCFSVA